MRGIQPKIAGFEDGAMAPRAKACKQFSEGRKAKKTDSPLGPPRRNATLLISCFEPIKTHVGFLTHRAVRESICIAGRH